MAVNSMNELLPTAGESAPPRTNGELVFNEPWEATAFGLAVALSDQKTYDWEFFRQRLIRYIAKAEGCEAYYVSWSKALQASVVESGLLSEEEILDRMASIGYDSQ